MSVVGRGDLATHITDREGFTFFCTGASNREPITDRQKHEELNRIWRMKDTTDVFVYFSTLQVYTDDSELGSRKEYVLHKRDMENLVKRSFDNYCIVRIGNITFGNNPSTIINYFKNCIADKVDFPIEDTYRYLVDADELNHHLGRIPKTGKHEYNITGKRVTVEKIVELIVGGKL